MPRLTIPAQPVHPGRIISIVRRWLTLILIGWLVYALGRALWIYIRLDAPLFDWQWYLVIIILLVGLTVNIVWRLPRSVGMMSVALGLLIWVVVGYFGWGQKICVYPARVAPIPISFWAGKSVVEAPEAILEDLQSAGGQLYMFAGKRAFGAANGQAFTDGLRRLAERDIGVYLAVSASDYLSVPVHDEWIANVERAAAFVQNGDLTNVWGIIGDAEHPKHTPLDILGTERDALFQAARDLDDLVRLMNDEYPDLPVGVTASWMLHLDRSDRDPDLSVIHRSSVDPPGHWDFVNVMIYSSYVPPSWRAYYVYMVERAMARLYPDNQPSYSIGLAAQGWPGEPSLGFDDLVRDARLSRAMGVREIVVFWLTLPVLEDLGDDFVRRFSVAVNDVNPGLTVEIPFSRPASLLIYGTLVADVLLDVRGGKGLFLLGWMVLSGFLVCRSK